MDPTGHAYGHRSLRLHRSIADTAVAARPIGPGHLGAVEGRRGTKDVKVDVTAAMVDAQRRNSDELTRRSRAYRIAVILLLGQVLVLAAAAAQSWAV